MVDTRRSLLTPGSTATIHTPFDPESMRMTDEFESPTTPPFRSERSILDESPAVIESDDETSAVVYFAPEAEPTVPARVLLWLESTSLSFTWSSLWAKSAAVLVAAILMIAAGRTMSSFSRSDDGGETSSIGPLSAGTGELAINSGDSTESGRGTRAGAARTTGEIDGGSSPAAPERSINQSTDRALDAGQQPESEGGGDSVGTLRDDEQDTTPAPTSKPRPSETATTETDAVDGGGTEIDPGSSGTPAGSDAPGLSPITAPGLSPTVGPANPRPAGPSKVPPVVIELPSPSVPASTTPVSAPDSSGPDRPKSEPTSTEPDLPDSPTTRPSNTRPTSPSATRPSATRPANPSATRPSATDAPGQNRGDPAASPVDSPAATSPSNTAPGRVRADSPAATAPGRIRVDKTTPSAKGNSRKPVKTAATSTVSNAATEKSNNGRSKGRAASGAR